MLNALPAPPIYAVHMESPKNNTKTFFSVKKDAAEFAENITRIFQDDLPLTITISQVKSGDSSAPFVIIDS